MPITCTVTALSGGGLSTAGDYLAGVAAGSCEPADLVVVPVRAGGEIGSDPALDAALGVRASDAVSAFQLTGKAGQAAQVVAHVGQATMRIAFLGIGDGSARALRRAGGELGRMLAPGECAVSALVAGQPDEQIRGDAEGILLGSYRYSEKSAPATADPPGGKGIEVRLLATAESAIRPAEIVAGAVALARDLANTPSIRKSPQWLADAAVGIAADAGLTVRVWTEQELADGGFGGICAVGSGSARPPRLIMLGYHPAGATRHGVLVGKGITFDSGALSLKSNDGMKAMKTDMAGGGAVIAVMSALARLGVPDRVTGLIAAAQNMPSGSAFPPRDCIHRVRRATGGGAQHRRRGSARASRRACLRRRRAGAGSGRRHRHPDRSGLNRSGQQPCGAVLDQRRAGRLPDRSWRGQRGAAVADALARGVPGRA